MKLTNELKSKNRRRLLNWFESIQSYDIDDREQRKTRYDIKNKKTSDHSFALLTQWQINHHLFLSVARRLNRIDERNNEQRYEVFQQNQITRDDLFKNR